jgi:hypothetical protein
MSTRVFRDSMPTAAGARATRIDRHPRNVACVDIRIVGNNKTMNGPTKDTRSGAAALVDVEDGVFWDAHWTLDDEWHPDVHVATTIAALVQARPAPVASDAAQPL